MLIDCHTEPNTLVVRCERHENWRVETIPGKSWDNVVKGWLVPIIAPNVSALRENFRFPEFTGPAVARIKQSMSATVEAPSFSGIHVPGTMAHQKNALAKSCGRPNYFFAHAMGSGKSLTILTLVANLHFDQGLSGLLVVCPSSIKFDVWSREAEKWMSGLGADYSIHVLEAGKQNKAESWMEAQKDAGALNILVVGTQALSNKSRAAYQVCEDFLGEFKCGMVVDESSLIKNSQASRTKNIITLGDLAKWRWCATGTKITQGIHDLYAQFRFLDWKILGHKSFFSFKNRYCVMGGFENHSIVSYRNVDELMTLIGPHIDVVRKEDANDLPPKTYQQRTATASPLQRRIFKELQHFMEADIVPGQPLSVATALERMTRYQQIAGGNCPKCNADGEWSTSPLDDNPKLEELIALLNETDGKVVIWAVFIPEIKAITARLQDLYGPGSVVSYYGGVSTQDRTLAIDKFQADPGCRFFVANQATAGMGLTLTAATTAVYYSNSFSYSDRVQSEDRIHRTGQVSSVTYIDLFIDLPIDATIKEALAKKTNISKLVADRLRLGIPLVNNSILVA